LRTLLIVVVSAWLSVPALRARNSPEEIAAQSALTWVAMIDGGKYADSWDAAAKLFQSQLTQDQWKSALTTVRAPLGKLISRTQKAAQPPSNVPGAPAGQVFMVLQFTTSFENKGTAVETVAMVDENGTWKAAGYFIQ
jgi:hypothetical protein